MLEDLHKLISRLTLKVSQSREHGIGERIDIKINGTE